MLLRGKRCIISSQQGAVYLIMLQRRGYIMKVMKVKKKPSLLTRVRRRYHHVFFSVGFFLGGVIGFNLRNIVDAAVEKVEAIREKRAAKKAEKAEK